MSQPVLSLPSFAKINWRLRILGKRPDGYHEVDTILQTISLQDDLYFETNGDGTIVLTCDDPSIPTDNENLVVRAARTIKTKYRIKTGARISLEKRIPTKAGLGGASSNAAVTLFALVKLWGIKTTPPELLDLAAGLGADVPFFLVGGRALAVGTGTNVSSLLEDSENDEMHLIVITPGASVSTANAYAAFDSSALTTKVDDPILSSSRERPKSDDSQPWAALDDLKNDFESVIFDIEPEIRRTKETLLQAGALGALLAGSGSSVFGIFATRETQQRALKEIQPEANWRIFPCVTVSRNKYAGALSSRGIKFLRSFDSGS